VFKFCNFFSQCCEASFVVRLLWGGIVTSHRAPSRRGNRSDAGRSACSKQTLWLRRSSVMIVRVSAVSSPSIIASTIEGFSVGKCVLCPRLQRLRPNTYRQTATVGGVAHDGGSGGGGGGTALLFIVGVRCRARRASPPLAVSNTFHGFRVSSFVVRDVSCIVVSRPAS